MLLIALILRTDPFQSVWQSSSKRARYLLVTFRNMISHSVIPRNFLADLEKKIVKYRIGENFLAGKLSFICLITFQYLEYDTKIMMGGLVEMYAIVPEE